MKFCIDCVNYGRCDTCADDDICGKFEQDPTMTENENQNDEKRIKDNPRDNGLLS